jgi:hypothetical protein
VKENPFTQQWLKALKSPHNINQLSTLRTVLKALNLADIKDYRNFIQTAPDIDKYVIFEDNKKTENGILYRIIPPSIEDTHENTIFGLDQVETNVIVDEDTNQKSVPVPSGDESITTNATHYKICYGTPTDFTDILKELWPHILKFLEQNPEHNHSKQWNKWITSGLNDTCDLSKLKEITKIETLDQLYLILHDSPAINKHFDIQWNHKIMYRPLRYNIQQETLAPVESPRIHIVRHLADHNIEFCILHKAVYDEIHGCKTMILTKRHL